MNKKLFILLISWMLMASSGLYAQSVFIDKHEVVVTVPVTPNDTVVVQQPESAQIQVLDRTWGVNLEDYLKDKIIYLSSHPSKKMVSKADIRYVYKVCQVPCQSERLIVYLSMTESKEFFLSKEDPTTVDEFYSSYLDCGTIATTPSRHQTDDTEYFGVAKPDGPDGSIKDLW